MNWANGVLMGMDTETTSVDPESARIVTAAIVVNDPAHEMDIAYNWLLNPGVDIPLGATAIHGISTEHAREHGINPSKAIPEILDVLASLQAMPMVMVNAPYDLTILDREMGRYGLGSLTLNSPVIDTLACDRLLDKYRRGRRTLTATAAAYGLTIKGAHTAHGDVDCSIRLVRAMAAKFPHFANTNLEELQEIQEKAHAKWAEEFMAYRRQDDPDFWCDGTWPFRKGNVK
jgi:DNA polymerase-3 subunit epsilon